MNRLANKFQMLSVTNDKTQPLAKFCSIPHTLQYTYSQLSKTVVTCATRMWANAQPDGRPAEHRWRPLFNAAKFG